MALIDLHVWRQCSQKRKNIKSYRKEDVHQGSGERHRIQGKNYRATKKRETKNKKKDEGEKNEKKKVAKTTETIWTSCDIFDRL